MDKKIWGKFDNIFKDFGDDFDFSKYEKTTPEEFMKGEFTKTEISCQDENGNKFTTETYISKDGKRKFTRKVVDVRVNPKYNSSDSKNNNQLYTLEEELRRAIKDEEFEKAVKLRDEIAKIKSDIAKKK